MLFLKEALKIKKENNGLLCRSILMRKLKVSAETADNLMKEVEKHAIDNSNTNEDNSNKLNECSININLKKIEIHILAEYK